MPHEQRTAAVIEIDLGQVQRFLDAQPGAPQDHNQAAVGGRARRSHPSE
jgi:hypothetical protein